jgi:hypothetical protein
VHRSADDGASWELCPQGKRPATGVASIGVAAGEPRHLYAGLDAGGVWASGDRGASWIPYGASLSGAVLDLASAPIALYALVEGILFRSASADAPWEQIEAGAEHGVALAALAGQQPALLLAQPHAIARSADGGASWTTGEPELPWEGGVTTIAAARYHIDTAFAGSAGGQLAQSTDRGRTWQILKQGLPPIRSIAAARLA